MLNKEQVAKIVNNALANEDELIRNELINGTSFKFLGSTNIDLYITTNKNYLEKIILNNLFKFQKSVTELEGKTIRDVYVNQKLIELNLKELKSKGSIGTINLENFKKERTQEISGENDIVNKSTFLYDASIMSKKKVVVELYNKELNRHYLKEMPSSVLTNTFSFIQRKKLINKIKQLIGLKYEPANNDTKEIIELLKIK